MIGILTFQRAHNHGALLQAFAIQQYLKGQGHQSELIDYRNIGTPEFYKKKINLRSFLKPSFAIYTLYKILFFKSFSNRAKVFHRFMDQHLIYSSAFYENREELIVANIDNFYRKIIVGSDQVWNLDLSYDDYSYFLDFIKREDQKISYAASFGRSIFDTDTLTKLKGFLSTFKALSVRESDAVKLVNKLSGETVEHVLDPTFLLAKEQWNNYAIAPDETEDYILCFVIGYCSKETLKICQEISKRKNLPIIMIGNTSFRPHFDLHIKFINVLSPFELIGYVKAASFVVTSSFHGTAFSIIFNKQFLSLSTSMKDSNAERNSRLSSILKLFNLRERHIACSTLPKNIGIINYEIVNRIIQEEINRSKKYLNRSIN